MAHQTVEQRLAGGGRFRQVFGEIGPELILVRGVGHGDEVQQQGEGHRRGMRRRRPGVDRPDGVVDLLGRLLGLVRLDEGQVVVDGPRDDVEVQALGRLRRLEHVPAQRLRRAVAEPLVHGQAVALGLGDLLALDVEEELVVEALGGRAAEGATDLGALAHALDQVLARHFVVDVQRGPAHGPVGLPLQLHVAAGDGQFGTTAGGIVEDDGPLLHMAFQRRHLQHMAGDGADRQEGRIGLAPFRAERRQHDGLHGVEPLEQRQQRRVEAAGPVLLR